MKKTLRILIPVILVAAIILCSAWYLLIYDKQFTKEMLLSCARFSDERGNSAVASWFYNLAYANSDNNESIAIELANQYKKAGNYTKAENVLANAIADGGNVELYIALCQTYIEQDKLLDAVNMLDSIANPQIKNQIDKLRPAVPTPPEDLPAGKTYNSYIHVPLSASDGTVYYSIGQQYPSLTATKYTEPIRMEKGLNRIRALTIKDGLVSKLADYSYTVGGVIEAVTFQDPEIEAAVRKELMFGDSVQIYTSDLWNITTFTVPEDAKNYDDLQHMIYLENLTITGGVSEQLYHIAALKDSIKQLYISQTDIAIDHLQIISGFPKLTTLTLSDCGLTSISALSGATKLTYLDISNNTVRNLEPLRSLTALQTLNLSENAIVDLSALSDLSVLESLDVSNNDLTSLSAICGLSKLNYLKAYHNRISDLGDIDQLSALTYLNLGENEVTDISKIALCLNLIDLDISRNSLTDISALSSLVALQYFNFSDNRIAVLPQWTVDCKLITIVGSNNLISDLENLSGLRQLNNVDLNYNTDLKDITPLTSCPSLIRVDVFGTKVSNVKPLRDMGVIVSFSQVN